MLPGIGQSDALDPPKSSFGGNLLSPRPMRYKMRSSKRSKSKIATYASGRTSATNLIRRRNKEMKTRSVRIIPGVLSKRCGFVQHWPWLSGLLVLGSGLVLTVTASPTFSRPSATPQNSPGSMIPGVKCVIGLETVKPGAKGTLTSLPTGLEFTAGKKKADIAISSIQDVFTGQESRQDVGGMGGTLVEAAIPYGGGRVVSLFSHKVDVLTVEYVDPNGGFHGAIFLLTASKATPFKNQLIAQGAKVSTHVEAPEPKEQKK